MGGRSSAFVSDHGLSTALYGNSVATRGLEVPMTASNLEKPLDGVFNAESRGLLQDRSTPDTIFSPRRRTNFEVADRSCIQMLYML